MPSLKALRKRISSVRSTQQITRAMKMVSAAKLRRAQEAAERARPYASKLTEMFSAVVADLGEDAHPLLARREEKRADLILITSDRGLCGAYNTNLIRLGMKYIGETPAEHVALFTVGRKGNDFMRRRGIKPVTETTGLGHLNLTEVARDLGQQVMQRFADGETDAVYVVYSRFRSAIAQIPTLLPLLPVQRPEGADAATSGPAVEYIFEPPRPELLGSLLPRYVQAMILQALLESNASEHAARMTAMDNATSNASDMMDRLTLQMNRARQATITTELMEIVSGAEALKG
jgi:F-type H+-transporting ATPase subunit gamma